MTIERIRELESTARALEPDRADRQRVREAVIDYAEQFLENLPDTKAYEIDKERAVEIRDAPISERPESIDALLRRVAVSVDTPGLNPASAGHLAFIPGGGVYAAALGDYLAAVTNRYAGIHFTGPGAVEMENLLIDWMADLVGYPEGSAGNLASGGSIANLIGIVTARDAHDLRAREYDRAVVYLTRQVHHSVAKALRVAGLRDCVTCYVPVDEGYRMRTDALESAIERDREAGLIPWLVIASAGTTDVGAIDPLVAIGEIAREHDLWYHIDAAYGGFFALVDGCRPRLAGMELSDSIILDPHKGLFLPYGTGGVIVKDSSALNKAHYYEAAYMQDELEDKRTILSPAGLSPELTKHFRGLRMWLPLKLYGLEPFRACLEEKLLLTRYFYEEVQKLGFEVGPEPELSVATYRYVPDQGDADEFNRRLVEEIHRDGRVFISSTTLDGRFVLRLAVLTFRTHLETIDLTLRVLEESVEAVLR